MLGEELTQLEAAESSATSTNAQSQSRAQGHNAEKTLHWDLTRSIGESSAKPASESVIDSAQYLSSDDLWNNEQATGTETAIGTPPECKRECPRSDDLGTNEQATGTETAIDIAQECKKECPNSDDSGTNDQTTGTETAIGIAPECKRECPNSDDLGNNDQATRTETANVGAQVSVSENIFSRNVKLSYSFLSVDFFYLAQCL